MGAGGRGRDGGGGGRHSEGGEGGPGRGDGRGLGHQREVHLDLPALVHLGCAAMSARGPRAVRDPNQIGAENENNNACCFSEIIRHVSI